ncbi:MAG TPA: hypothetical protein VFK60_10850 [Casimicrobiaceae bacterium]|nr:hypothetical protein [Casimicrobiaceae bacterium]
MFAFLKPSSPPAADPLASVRAASTWLDELPTLDIVARQQIVLRAFDAMRQSTRPIDTARVDALQHVDAALRSDRRKLIRQFVENFEASPRVAERIWTAVFDLAQAFIGAYQAAIEAALVPSAHARWKPRLAQLFARLIHYYGIDARLRISRHEHWIPARWAELHRAYLRATELGLDRDDPGAAAAGGRWSVEQEYVYVLLLHQLNSGNLSPANFDWVAAQFRVWSRRLELLAIPKSMEGFFVDVAGREGLRRRTGQDSGAMLRYLDTTPVAEQLEVTLAALRNADATEQGPMSEQGAKRAAILEKARAAIAPNLNVDLRRDPRISCVQEARVRIGVARVIEELVRPVAAAEPPADQIEVFAVAGAPHVPPAANDESDTLSGSLARFPPSLWQVRDRSVAGLRICASGGVGQSLMLGTLVAVREANREQWVLGVVRRVNKFVGDEIEAGLSVIAERIVAVSLHAQRDPRGDLGIEVGGLDSQDLGPRFDAIYLPPPSRPDKPLSARTLIVPTHEYREGRRLVLATGRTIYTIALRQVVEQRADWTWVAMQILDRSARG